MGNEIHYSKFHVAYTILDQKNKKTSQSIVICNVKSRAKLEVHVMLIIRENMLTHTHVYIYIYIAVQIVENWYEISQMVDDS